MTQINKTVLNNIQKSFSIEKGTYKDNDENRKLGRVGQEYGGVNTAKFDLNLQEMKGVLNDLKKQGKEGSDHYNALAHRFNKVLEEKKGFVKTEERKADKAKNRKVELEEFEGLKTDIENLEDEVDHLELNIADTQNTYNDELMQDEEALAESMKEGFDDPMTNPKYQKWSEHLDSYKREIKENKDSLSKVKAELDSKQKRHDEIEAKYDLY